MSFITEKGIAGLAAPMLVSRAGMPPAAAQRLARTLVEAGRATEVGGWLIASTVFEERAAALVAAVKAHHAAQPLAPGMPREEAREKLFGSASPGIFDAVVGALSAAGRLVARETLSVPGHQLSLSPEETRARDVLVAAFRDGGLTPPDPRTVATGQAIDAGTADRVVKLLVREKAVVRMGELLFHADALAKLRADIADMKAAGSAKLDVSFFKERYGVSRKFAIPLLEYLDRERVTRRVGDARVIL